LLQPKYQVVKDHIIFLISSGQLSPGDRLPSENELATLFGISRQTVRHALTTMVSQGVLSRRQGSGTYVAQSAKRIGVCIKYLDTYIFPDIVRGIDEKLREQAGSLVLMSSRNDPELERSSLESLMSYQLDGLIWEPALSGIRDEKDETLAFVRRSGIPFVMINGALPGDSASSILTSDQEGMRLLINHLHELEHRRIAGVFCRDMAQGLRRYDGFKSGMEACGIKAYDEEVLFFNESQLTDDPEGDFHEELRLFMMSVIRRGVTAVCCYNDLAAQAVIKMAEALGTAVPQELAVTGFDAAERLDGITHIISSLTSVVHPCAELGRTAVTELLRLVHDKSVRVIEMPASVIYGAST